jgi:hypothetical protein
MKYIRIKNNKLIKISFKLKMINKLIKITKLIVKRNSKTQINFKRKKIHNKILMRNN